MFVLSLILFFFFNDTAPTEIYTLSLHDALPILAEGRLAPEEFAAAKAWAARAAVKDQEAAGIDVDPRSEEHTSELQSRVDLVCRLLLEKKKKKKTRQQRTPITTNIAYNDSK